MSGQRITCPRCGQVNLPGATTCKKCHGALGDAPTDAPAKRAFTKAEQARIDQITRGSGRGTSSRRGDAGWVVMAGVLGILGTAGWVAFTMLSLSDRELSAVQVSQLYTEGIFWVLVCIGILLAGILWVANTRE